MRQTPPPWGSSSSGSGGVCDNKPRRPSPAPQFTRIATAAALLMLLPLSSCHALAPAGTTNCAGCGVVGGGAGGTPPTSPSPSPSPSKPRTPSAAPSPSRRQRATSYREARRVRALLGHDAAAPLYRELLILGGERRDRPEDGRENDRDLTAASRMAASFDSPRRHDEIFTTNGDDGEASEADAASLRELLANSGYDSAGVHDAFGIFDGGRRWCAGPAFVRPVTAGEVGRRCPFQFRDREGDGGVDEGAPSSSGDEVLATAVAERRRREEESRNCLIALFLLGFTLPRSTLSTCLLGSDASVKLLERLGLVHPCDLDPDLMVPYAQLFPIDIDVQLHSMEEEQSSMSWRNLRRLGEDGIGDGDSGGGRPLANGPDDAVNRGSSSAADGGGGLKGRQRRGKKDGLGRGRRRRSIIIATDWHPDVLSSATVGRSGDGAVMYIGPDSLALVQHLPPLPSLRSLDDDHGGTAIRGGNSGGGRALPLRILDVCCGSGVQALCALAALGEGKTMPTLVEEEDGGEKGGEGPPRSNSHRRRCGPRSEAVAVCLDVNPRAVRFSRFNSLLNGFGEQVRALQADLTELERDLVASSSSSIGKKKDLNGRGDSSLQELREAIGDLMPLDDDGDARGAAKIGGGQDDDNETSLRFDLILANPPFIPTPSAQRQLPKGNNVKATVTDPAQNREGRFVNATDGGGGSIEHPSSSSTAANSANISKRYGLFSDGGSDGEEILGSIVRSAPDLLSPRPGAMLAVVSEFMNPGPDLCRKIMGWWHQSSSPLGGVVVEEVAGIGGGSARVAAAGVLFTNERPVSADVYASRRAGDDEGGEFRIWRKHLNDRGITRVSPGLLFIARGFADGRPRRRAEDAEGGAPTATAATATSGDSPPPSPAPRDGLDLLHCVVPPSGSGSLWTPHNREAVSFTRAKWRGFVDSLTQDGSSS